MLGYPAIVRATLFPKAAVYMKRAFNSIFSENPVMVFHG